jgi:Tol biopolymer transport system component
MPAEDAPMLEGTVLHYRILERLGKGGMGEVYKAADMRLGRLVALKFLSESVASEPTAGERFQREARAVSSLNHPNICTLYDIHSYKGRFFIAMKYVEGVTLAARIAERPLRVEEVLAYGIQIADGLDAAHSRGIVHRDIKPSNIFITTRGDIKVMDFGLAKVVPVRRAHRVPSAAWEMATLAMSDELVTSPGIALGTVVYMSPEQARGDDVDERTDLFSLGVVLYEMATGTLPFQGKTTAAVFDAILNRPPVAPSQLRPELPPPLDQVICTALEKDTETRHQTAAELRAALKRVKRDTESGRISAAGAAQPQRRVAPSRLWWMSAIAIAAVLLAVAAAGLYQLLGRRQAAPTFQRIHISRLTSSGNVSMAAISPDGKYVAYVATEGGKQGVWLRQVVSGSTVPICPPTETVYGELTFSPDGNFIYYGTSEGPAWVLHKMPVLGGAIWSSTVEHGGRLAISSDGAKLAYIRYLPNGEDVLLVANADGTQERRISSRTKPEALPGSLAWSPDGKTVACSVMLRDAQGAYGSVVAVPANGGPGKLITSHRWFIVRDLQWLYDGRGLIVNSRDRAAAPPQIWHVSYPSGETRRITNDLDAYLTLSITADSKSLATIRSDLLSNIWVAAPHRDMSHARKITSGSGRYDGTLGVSESPDGRIVYVSRASGNYELWIMDRDGSGARQLTTGEGVSWYPRVTPDGRYIVFSSNRTGTFHIWRIDLDGRNLKQLSDGTGETLPDCSPDSQSVVYSIMGTIVPTLWSVSINGGAPRQLTQVSSTQPAVSPDGKSIAFLDLYEEWGPMRGVWVLQLGTGQPKKLFEVPAPFVRWRPSGTALTYVRNEGSVSNIWSQSLAGGTPRQLTDFATDRIFSFDWARQEDWLVCARGVVNRDVVLITDASDTRRTP